MFLNSLLWIIYDIVVGPWPEILDEVVSEISMVISVSRFGWKNLDKNIRINQLSIIVNYKGDRI